MTAFQTVFARAFDQHAHVKIKSESVKCCSHSD